MAPVFRPKHDDLPVVDGRDVRPRRGGEHGKGWRLIAGFGGGAPEAGNAKEGCAVQREIADIIEDIQVSKIDIRIALSPEWKSSISHPINNFSVTYQQLDILKSAAKSLNVDDPPRPAQVVGRIKRLETEGNPADLIEDKSRREIEVSWVNEDNQLVHVKMALSPEDYIAALEAHKNGQTVLASGLLSKSGRTSRLEPVQTFKVIS